MVSHQAVYRFFEDVVREADPEILKMVTARIDRPIPYSVVEEHLMMLFNYPLYSKNRGNIAALLVRLAAEREYLQRRRS